MEDVVGVYHRPPDPRFPVVCFDEGGKEPTVDARPALPMAPRVPATAAQAGQPGQVTRIDHEYVRQGSANLFVWTAPHLGLRAVTVTARRTAVDFAVAMRDLVDDPRLADAERIVLVLDNLNTHRPASLYKAFLPHEARRILDRLEWHYTPLHGSWLNIAEIELGVLARQCLARRIPDDTPLQREVAAWAAHRNAAQVGVDWQFTAVDARVTLHRLYPVPVFAE